MPTHPFGSRRILAIVAIASAWILASAPLATAATVGNINTILPAGRRITGKLLSDTTGNPIAGAFVVAFASDYSSSGSATTNASGVFTILGLKGGTALTYRLDIDPDDDVHAAGCYTQANADHYGVGTACGFPGPQTAPLNVSLLNVGTIRAAKGATISGVVKGGTTTSSTALVGVYVSLSGADYDYQATITGGKFAFKALPPGTYQLTFETPSTMNYRDGAWKSGALPNYSPSTPSNIVLGTTNKAANVILPTGRIVTGRVETSANVGIANAWVTLNGTNGQESAYTGADGTFALKGVSAGTDYRLSVDSPWDRNYQDGFFTTSNAAHWILNPNSGSTIVVNGPEVLADIRPPAGFRIKGKVLGTNGLAISGAFVTASLVTGFESSGDSTGTDGLYDIIGLEPGTYEVRISAPSTANAYGGWYDAATATYRFTLNEANADQLLMNSANPVRTLQNVRLRVGHTVTGTVRGGSPTSSVVLPGASVVISGTADFGFATTNASGVYTITGLAPGEYRVNFTSPSSKNFRGGYWKSGSPPNWSGTYAGSSPLTVP